MGDVAQRSVPEDHVESTCRREFSLPSPKISESRAVGGPRAEKEERLVGLLLGNDV